MIAHQQPGSIPHPHGWIQFPHTPYHHMQQSPTVPMLTGAVAGRVDSARSMPRFTPSARVYNPNPRFSLFAESPPVNYSHTWGRDRIPHFPQLWNRQCIGFQPQNSVESTVGNFTLEDFALVLNVNSIIDHECRETSCGIGSWSS